MITKFPPWPSPARAYDFVLNRPRGALLAIPMAGGKTKVAIDLIQNSDAKKILVAAPLAVIPAWVNEFEKHAADPTQFPVLALDEGSIKKRTEIAADLVPKFSDRTPIVVINYQAIWREPFRSWALSQMWDVVTPMSRTD